MKVVFCSPLSDSDNVIKGGINMWGRHIMAYYTQNKITDVELIPISFDRLTDVIEGQTIISRIIAGFNEYLPAIRETITKMDQYRPNVIHICTSAGLGLLRDLVLIKAAKKRCIKSIIHLHFGRIPELLQENNWEYKILLKVLKLCDVIVVMNRPSEKALLSKAFNNVVYLPNPIGYQTLEYIQSIEGNYKRIPRRLLFCGHVILTKGVIELVEGCLHIPNIELRIVGKWDEDIKQAMLTIASRSKRKNTWINFIGELPHDEVIKEYLQADLFVFPSYTEGFPNVILEAMACGCPIVSSDVGAIPEMLDIDGDACGLCFKSQSSEEVFKAINSIIDNDKKKYLYALKAKNRVNNMYAMPKVWEQMVKIWKNEYHKKS